MDEPLNPSICIPRIFSTIPRDKIIDVFTALKLGPIDYVDMHVGRDFQRVYIYFKYWFTTPFAAAIKNRFLEGEEMKIIYNDPWFWKCRLNSMHRRSSPHSSKVYYSKYNTRNQIIALKRTLDKEREVHQKNLKSKDDEIVRLRALITECMGDDALLNRKRIQQKRAKEWGFLDSSGILFTN